MGEYVYYLGLRKMDLARLSSKVWNKYVKISFVFFSKIRVYFYFPFPAEPRSSAQWDATVFSCVCFLRWDFLLCDFTVLSLCAIRSSLGSDPVL